MPCAAVGDVVAVDRRDHHVLQLHLGRDVRQAQRLERIRWAVGPAAVHVAVAARARARVAEDLEGRGAAAPALADVRAARLLADGVEALAVDELLDVVVARIRARRPDLHPVRAARPLRYGQRGLHPASLVTGLPLAAEPSKVSEPARPGNGERPNKEGICETQSRSAFCGSVRRRRHVGDGRRIERRHGDQHKWKFDPTINAPWAMEGDDEELDAPDAAAGLCRSAPFNTPAGAYAPLAPTEVDAIIGDPVNNSGFSNFGCTTPQNETSIAVNPQNPQQPRRRRERLSRLLRLHGSERRHRLGVLLVRRWQDVGQRTGSRR